MSLRSWVKNRVVHAAYWADVYVFRHRVGLVCDLIKREDWWDANCQCLRCRVEHHLNLQKWLREQLYGDARARAWNAWLRDVGRGKVN